jgi:hypothetical protein
MSLLNPVSESLFSMDGDFADVEAIAALRKRHGAAFIVDEAHAMGALGPEGRGLAATGLPLDAHRHDHAEVVIAGQWPDEPGIEVAAERDRDLVARRRRPRCSHRDLRQGARLVRRLRSMLARGR